MYFLIILETNIGSVNFSIQNQKAVHSILRFKRVFMGQFSWGNNTVINWESAVESNPLIICLK